MTTTPFACPPSSLPELPFDLQRGSCYHHPPRYSFIVLNFFLRQNVDGLRYVMHCETVAVGRFVVL